MDLCGERSATIVATATTKPYAARLLFVPSTRLASVPVAGISFSGRRGEFEFQTAVFLSPEGLRIPAEGMSKINRTREADRSRFVLCQVVIGIFLLVAAFPGLQLINAAPGSRLRSESDDKNLHSYADEPLDKLVKQIPELKMLRPAHDQQLLPLILEKTGETVDSFFHNTVDLVAHEEITEENLGLTLFGPVRAKRHVRYDYLILHRRDGNVLTLREYRTDLNGNRVEQPGLDEGFSVTSGFALISSHFASGSLSNSTFRYLGDEVLGRQDTHVVAFAEQPGRTKTRDTVTWPGGSIPVLVQGIAWVDKNSFQMIRIRTDLLAPDTDIALTQQTTVTFGSTNIPGIETSLWLPREVLVLTKFASQSYRNRHRYTGYERFRVSAKIVAPH